MDDEDQYEDDEDQEMNERQNQMMVHAEDDD